MNMYGLLKQEHLVEIAEAVCDCLGYGYNINADKLLIETAGAETLKGTLKDPTIMAGIGITQFDQMPFYDVKTRARESDKEKIKKSFDIDINLIEWEHLRYNPLLCMIFTRLKYKKVPSKIPDSLKERAEYWKRWYNSYAGKGTVEHYIEANSDQV